MILTYMNDSEDIILSLILISKLELKSRPVKEENANMSQMISATSCFTASKQRQKIIDFEVIKNNIIKIEYLKSNYNINTSFSNRFDLLF